MLLRYKLKTNKFTHLRLLDRDTSPSYETIVYGMIPIQRSRTGGRQCVVVGRGDIVMDPDDCFGKVHRWMWYFFTADFFGINMVPVSTYLTPASAPLPRHVVAILYALWVSLCPRQTLPTIHSEHSEKYKFVINS